MRCDEIRWDERREMIFHDFSQQSVQVSGAFQAPVAAAVEAVQSHTDAWWVEWSRVVEWSLWTVNSLLLRLLNRLHQWKHRLRWRWQTDRLTDLTYLTWPDTDYCRIPKPLKTLPSLRRLLRCHWALGLGHSWVWDEIQIQILHVKHGSGSEFSSVTVRKSN